MRFDFSRLKEQLSEDGYGKITQNFTNEKLVRERIIEKVVEVGIYTETLETGSSTFFGGFQSIDFTNITFEKVDNETIEVYLHQNSFQSN